MRALVEAVAAPRLPGPGAVAATSPGLPDAVRARCRRRRARRCLVGPRRGRHRQLRAARPLPRGRDPGRPPHGGRRAGGLRGRRGGDGRRCASHGATVVDTRGFVRPRLEAGRVRLLVQPAAGGVVVPFEAREPAPLLRGPAAGGQRAAAGPGRAGHQVTVARPATSTATSTGRPAGPQAAHARSPRTPTGRPGRAATDPDGHVGAQAGDRGEQRHRGRGRPGLRAAGRRVGHRRGVGAAGVAGEQLRRAARRTRQRGQQGLGDRAPPRPAPRPPGRPGRWRCRGARPSPTW